MTDDAQVGPALTPRRRPIPERPTADELALLDGPELTARMRDLQPLIAAHALEAERLRRPADAVIDALCASGIFHHFVPKRFGGLELGVEDFVDIVLPIGEVCASTAWVASFYMEHNLILSLFPEDTQVDVFGAQPYILAPGAAFPAGRALPVPGGFLLTGRWNYASGIMHADWAMVMALAAGEQPFDYRWFLMPVDDVVVEDVWTVDGLAGTGSNDIVMTDVFVSEQRSLPVAAMSNGTAPGSRVHDNPMYAMPMATFLALTAALPVVGAARGGLTHFRERLSTRVSGGVRQAERHALQALLGEVDVDVHVAEMLIRESAAIIVRMSADGDADNIPLRAQLRARIAYATSLCRDSLRKMVDANGSSAHVLDNPLQRALRDVTMATAHVLHDRMTATELNGCVQLGIPPRTPMI